jgi:murein DD-endopeptidase MepM/ murein hydrolase activator NlpD
MRRFLISLIVFTLAALGTAFLFLFIFNKSPAPFSQKDTPANEPDPNSEVLEKNQTLVKDVPQSDTKKFLLPIRDASSRITKKPFGIHITPETSPIQPERFSGYHTGTDFEIFPDEEFRDVSVYAVCDGSLIIKKYASGYGGVAIEKCELYGNAVTVIYGHLSLSSISQKVDSQLKAGDQLGILGKGYSQETDGERKHLHLGIHKDPGISMLGYVQKKSGLSAWIDPCRYFCMQ